MPITYDQLISLLSPSAGVLQVPAASLVSPDPVAMFNLFFTNGVLSLTGAEAQGDGISIVTVTGNIATHSVLNLDKAALVTSAWTVQPDGSLTVQLSIQPTNPDWGLSTSFPVLAGSAFDLIDYSNATFILDSTSSTVLSEDFRESFGYSADIPQVAQALIKYLSFGTQALFTGSAGILTNLFMPPVTLFGPVEIYFLNNTVTDPPTPQMYPQMCLNLTSDSGRTVEVGDYEFTFDLQVASPLVEFYDTSAGVGLSPAAAIAIRTTFETASVDIPVAALIYPASSATLLTFYAGRIPQGPVIAGSGLPAMLGGANVDQLLTTAPGFPIGVFDNVRIQGVSLSMKYAQTLTIEDITVTVAAVDPEPSTWTILGGLITFNQFGVSLTAGFEGTQVALEGTLFGSCALFGNESIQLAASIRLPSTFFVISLSEKAPISLGAMLSEFLGISIAIDITAATFELLGNLRDPYFNFQAIVTNEWVIFGPDPGGFILKDIYLTMGAAIVTENNTRTWTPRGGITAQLSIGESGDEANVAVTAAYPGDGAWVFSGSSIPGQSVNLTAVLTQFAALFGVELPPGLPAVNLGQLSLSFNSKTTDLGFTGALTIPALSFNLTNIPLIGPYLNPADVIALRSIVFLIRSAQTSQQPQAPRKNLIALTILVGLGPKDTIALQIPIVGELPPPPRGGMRPYQPTPGYSTSTSGNTAGQVAYPTSGDGLWIPIQKTFGPFAVQKIGFSLSLDGLSVQMNCSLTVRKVTFQLLGVGLEFPLLPEYSPSFVLHGIGLMIKRPEIELSGTLVAVGDGQYDGSIAIRISRFGFSALGSYATTDPPSFFVFAMIDFPIGPTPGFFIKGLSGGFGFNRSLILPPLSGVASYPLVLGATPGPKNPFGVNPTIASFTQAMDDYMTVEIGEYWIAAGMRVTTYGTIDTYALATVAGGADWQIGLIGMSTLIVPPMPGDGAGGVPPVAYAQLALEAVLDLTIGELGIAAQLTPNSFVLSRKCQLTGGFAFYLWFPPNENAWQFVVTLGGYNPYYQRPSYFPTVPLLGVTIAFNPTGQWMGINVSFGFSIKGGLYFAVTMHAVMMGISVNSTFQLDGFKAWINLSVDFLVQWKPFYYDVQAGLTIGFSATIKIWIVRVSFSISAGATMHIWGPDFSFTANIDLIVFSFTFSGGAAAAQAPEPIAWDDFVSSFLGSNTPAPQPAGKQVAPTPSAPMLATVPPEPPSPATVVIVTAQISEGVLCDLRGKGAEVDFIVDPQRFVLVTSTQIPAKSVTLNDVAATVTWNTDFGVAPMSVASADFNSAHSVTFLCENQPYTRLEMTPVIMPAAKALWYRENDLNATLNDPADIASTAQGVTIVPVAQEPAHSMPVAMRLLLTRNVSYSWTWDAVIAPASDPWAGDDPTAVFTQTVNEPAVNTTRSNIVIDLICNGFAVSNAINTAGLANPETLGMLAPVNLGYLGENTAQVQ